METPKHIKYLSIIFFLNAAIALLIGGLTLISTIHLVLERGETLGDLSAVVSAVMMDFGWQILTTLLAVILLIFLGISLRKLKPWARTITLVYSAIGILLGLVNILAGDHSFSYHFLVQIYAVWVLTRPVNIRAFDV